MHVLLATESLNVKGPREEGGASGSAGSKGGGRGGGSASASGSGSGMNKMNSTASRPGGGADAGGGRDVCKHGVYSVPNYPLPKEKAWSKRRYQIVEFLRKVEQKEVQTALDVATARQRFGIYLCSFPFVIFRVCSSTIMVMGWR